jgi:hypothetical protein
MLARIRAATSGSLLARAVPVRLVALLRTDVGVLRDLDLTAAYGTEAACPRKGQRGCRIPGQPSLSPS